jgi:acyl carrier protein phosphodiesterase
MNFLAHFFLSGDDDELRVGNFLGDYLRNAQVAQLPERMQDGVQLHREIDSYTDQHPQVLQGVRRLYDRHSKYAPVVVDIFYDYLLTFNWERYSQQPIRDFMQEIYQCLQRYHAVMPPPVHQYVPNMIADDWLASYGSHNGLAITFSRLRKRTSKPHLIDGALESLIQDFPLLNEEFNQFFPDIIAHVQPLH